MEAILKAIFFQRIVEWNPILERERNIKWFYRDRERERERERNISGLGNENIVVKERLVSFSSGGDSALFSFLAVAIERSTSTLRFFSVCLGLFIYVILLKKKKVYLFIFIIFLPKK